jgi:hypothetical protein
MSTLAVEYGVNHLSKGAVIPVGCDVSDDDGTAQ